jgi:hypothetical protein
MLSMNRITLLGNGLGASRGYGQLLGLGDISPQTADNPADAVKLQNNLYKIAMTQNGGKGDETMMPVTLDSTGKAVLENKGSVSMVTVIALLNTVLTLGETLTNQIPGGLDGLGPDIKWVLGLLRDAKDVPGIKLFVQPWTVVTALDSIDDIVGLFHVDTDSFVNALNNICGWVANNAGIINTAITLAHLVDEGGDPAPALPPSLDLPPATGAGTTSAPVYFEKSYPVGSVQRYNTTRGVWSIYAPVGVYETAAETATRMAATSAAVMKTSITSGLTKIKSLRGLGATYPATNEPNPTVTNPHGVVLQTTKIDESPASQGQLPNVGNESDKGAYPSGSIARYNTTRNIWSVYSPKTIAGLGMFSGGRSIYGAALGVSNTEFPEPSPDPPAGTAKKAEVPGSPAAPPAGTKNGGTETDKAFYMKWWFWVGLGGAAAAGTSAYFLLRKKPGARPVSGPFGRHLKRRHA